MANSSNSSTTANTSPSPYPTMNGGESVSRVGQLGLNRRVGESRRANLTTISSNQFGWRELDTSRAALLRASTRYGIAIREPDDLHASSSRDARSTPNPSSPNIGGHTLYPPATTTPRHSHPAADGTLSLFPCTYTPGGSSSISISIGNLNLNLGKTIDEPKRRKNDSKDDGRIRSLPHEKHGPYTCSECHKVFLTSQLFAAHAVSGHYKYETEEQKRNRRSARNRKKSHVNDVVPPSESGRDGGVHEVAPPGFAGVRIKEEPAA